MTTKPKPRYLRFSLRAMLVVVTVFGVWLGVQVNRAHKQKRAVHWVTQNGGLVSYDWQLDEDERPSGNTEPPGLRWLRLQIGDDYFQSVVRVFTSESEDDDISLLANLTELKVLYLNHPSVSDVSPLASMSNLEFLFLSRMNVSDLSPLANLSNLEELWLEETPVNDVSPLARLTKLKSLILSNTQVSDLSPLVNLSNLESLEIKDTQVTDEQISELQVALPNCTINR